MLVLFPYMYIVSGFFGFLLLLTACDKAHNPIYNADAVFKIERRDRSNLSSFYSIEDRIMFVNRENRNQPYDQIISIQVDGECYGDLGHSFKVNKAIPSNTLSFYTVLSLEQLQPNLNTYDSEVSVERFKNTHQTYQCSFSFIGIMTNGSTKSVQNIKVKIPKRPRGGIVINHRNRIKQYEQLELTELDLRDFHITILHPLPGALMTLKCSDFQETTLFHFKNNSKKSLASIFNLQRHYPLLMANPLQQCHITYGTFGDPHWAWSISFNFLFQEAFEGVFDLRFDLEKITDSQILQANQIESTDSLWIKLGVLKVFNPFSKPMLITLNKNHNNYLNSHIYYLEGENRLGYNSEDILKKESHDIFLQFTETNTENHETAQNNNILNIFGGKNYALHIRPNSFITRQVVIRTLGASHYSTYEVLGFELIKSENPHQQDFFKLYFHNHRGSFTIPIFDEFKHEPLISICAFQLCHRAFETMLYNGQIRTGQAF